MAGREARGVLQDIDLLCESGAGLSAVVGPMCGLIRTYADVVSVAFFWVDAEGRPTGFYHDGAPAALKDLFVTRFDELFSGPDEVNMVMLLRSGGPSIGRYLQPDEQARFRRSNIQRYLCDPLGHQHALDIRVDVDGAGRALCVMWRGAGHPFGQSDIARAKLVQLALDRLLECERADARWAPVAGGTGELVTDAAGDRLLAIDPAADRLLMNSHLLDQRLSMTQPPDAPPAFARLLAVEAGARGEAESVLAVPTGRLVARARLARAPGGGGKVLLISLLLQVAHDALCIQHLLGQRLTAMQRRVALYGMLGGERADCITALGTTPEAMKKHCAAVFAVLELGKWSDLAERGERLAAELAA